MSDLHMVIDIWSREDNNPVYTLLITRVRREREREGVRVREMN